MVNLHHSNHGFELEVGQHRTCRSGPAPAKPGKALRPLARLRSDARQLYTRPHFPLIVLPRDL